MVEEPVRIGSGQRHTPLTVTDQRPFLLRAAAYPGLYAWYVFFSALDIMFTWVILAHGGREENAIADWILRQFNLPGMVAYKFMLVVFVVLVCEVVSRHRFQVGQKLARWAIALSAFPVFFGIGQLLTVISFDGSG